MSSAQGLKRLPVRTTRQGWSTDQNDKTHADQRLFTTIAWETRTRTVAVGSLGLRQPGRNHTGMSAPTLLFVCFRTGCELKEANPNTWTLLGTALEALCSQVDRYDTSRDNEEVKVFALSGLNHVYESHRVPDEKVEGLEPWAAALILMHQDTSLLLSVVTMLVTSRPVPYVYYHYVGNVAEWSLSITNDTGSLLWQRYQQVKIDLGLSGPYTHLIALCNLSFAARKVHYFDLLNMGGTAGCLCYVRAATIAGFLVFMIRSDEKTGPQAFRQVFNDQYGKGSGNLITQITYDKCTHLPQEFTVATGRGYTLAWVTPDFLYQSRA